MKGVSALDRNGVSLEEFITQNDRLLSALGIFAALIVLSKGLSSQIFNFSLSFLWVGGLILVWFEIWSKLPKGLKPTLFLFRYVLLWSGIGLISYWLYEFRAVWDMFLFIPATALVAFFILSSTLPILRNVEIAKTVFGFGYTQKSKPQKFVRGLAWLALFYTSLLVGGYASLGANSFFDLLKQTGI